MNTNHDDKTTSTVKNIPGISVCMELSSKAAKMKVENVPRWKKGKEKGQQGAQSKRPVRIEVLGKFVWISC